MRKLFFEKVDGDEIVIGGDEHKHIAFSLRIRKGDELIVCACGIDYTVVVTDITKTETRARVVSKVDNTSEPTASVTLFFGVLKGDKNDYVIQKCTELGAKRFVPFVSDFSSVRAENIKTDRLNRIALEAAKQSGRGSVPVVEETARLIDLFDRLSDFDLVVFPYENEEDRQLGDFIKNKAVGNIAVIVGSEGGFSESEANKLRDISGGSITLGKRILRADTACAATLAVLMYELGEWRR